MNRILINKELYDRQITKKFIKESAEKILEYMGIDKAEVSITLTDDRTIQSINKEWRGKNMPTDVLSFPIDEKPPKYRYRVLGDIVISLPYAKRQSEEIGLSYREEVIRLLIHGILHLLGYDHERSKKDEDIMFSLQDQIFENLSSYFSKTTHT